MTQADEARFSGPLTKFLGSWHLVDHAQVHELKPGWLWLRSPLGERLLQGINRDDLDFILGHIRTDGAGDAFLTKLLAVYEAEDLPPVLEALAECVIRPVSSGESERSQNRSPKPLPICFVGDGVLTSALAGLCSANVNNQGAPPATLSSDSFLTSSLPVGTTLVILCSFGMSGQEVSACQRRCVEQSLPLLVLGADFGQLTIGPYLLPGEPGCVLCRHLPRLPPGSVSENDLAGFVAALNFDQAASWMSPGFIHAQLDPIIQGHCLGKPEALPLHRQRRIDQVGRVSSELLRHNPLCPHCRAAVNFENHLQDKYRRLRLRVAAERVRVFDHSPNRQAVPHRSDTDQSVGILGGGTAGYLTALALRKRFPELDVTLIESSRVPVIGVGEATTPLMPQFLHQDLGLDMADFFARVRPTVKLGIRFDWGATPAQTFLYPFGPLHLLEPLVFEGNPRHSSLQALFMDAGTMPVTAGDAELMRGLASRTAYHLENRRFVRYLQEVARERGIRVLDRQISAVEPNAEGNRIAALISEAGERFSYDRYVDCSGFRSLLMGQALGSRFIRYDDQLFTDTAIVATVPHGGRVQPYTSAQAMSAGWCWNTPQREADHRGYVFSSAHCSDEAALAEMRSAFPKLDNPRTVRFTPGRRDHFWRGNVFALGNAYGFVEPLESTALHMLIRQIGMLLQVFPLNDGDPVAEALLNRKVADYWDYLKWFLSIHFRYNTAMNSSFWQRCRHDMAPGVYDEWVALYRAQGLLSYGPARSLGFDVPDPLWGAEGIDVLLSGQSVATRAGKPMMTRQAWLAWRRAGRRLAEAYPAQAEGLAILEEEPAGLTAWARGLRDQGPAFIR